MAIYLLLALDDDGRVTVHEYARAAKLVGLHEMPSLTPERIGTDRGPFATYEVDGYSIDVRRLEPTT